MTYIHILLDFDDCLSSTLYHHGPVKSCTYSQLSFNNHYDYLSMTQSSETCNLCMVFVLSRCHERHALCRFEIELLWPVSRYSKHNSLSIISSPGIARPFEVMYRWETERHGENPINGKETVNFGCRRSCISMEGARVRCPRIFWTQIKRVALTYFWIIIRHASIVSVCVRACVCLCVGRGGVMRWLTAPSFCYRWNATGCYVSKHVIKFLCFLFFADVNMTSELYENIPTQFHDAYRKKQTHRW